MASRVLPPLRSLKLTPRTPFITATRTFRLATPLRETATAPLAAPRRSMGAFRGGVFGFLLGAVVSGATTFYYVLEEYRVSNELLTEDIYVSDPDVSRYERIAI